ncbi:hypothetical protein [Mycobacteroides abscessus]|uniref:hypothetical protein n=1 Tax=Mycobacteroides abscessus TaxID=36809 RepID=UPI0012FFD9DB
MIESVLNQTSLLVVGNWNQILYQIILPLVAGSIGGSATILWATINDVGLSKKTEISYSRKRRIKFAFVGAVAGFVAVNLLNPKGDFAQVTTIAVLAGLNGMTYLSKNSLSDGSMEKVVMERKSTAHQYIDALEKDIDIEGILSETDTQLEQLDNEEELDAIIERLKLRFGIQEDEGGEKLWEKIILFPWITLMTVIKCEFV